MEKANNKKKTIQNLTLSALFMALGMVLPFLTGQIPQIGSMMLPMHIPVLLCGFICGWQYGAVVGFILPLFRFAVFGMPPILPTGIAMAFELAAYGGVSGFLYSRSRWKCIKAVYRCLLIAMISGRVVWGVVRVLMVGVTGQAFTWQVFMAGAFINAIPGIIVQLILIPALMLALHRAGMVPFGKNDKVAAVQK